MRRVKNGLEPTWLRDSGGGVLILRGTNVSGEAKHRPDRLPVLAAGDLDRLRQELGASAIRLLAFWEAIEPEPGSYDLGYLGRLRQIAEAAGRAGLWVILDMHQDLWGRAFGSAGAPAWTVPPEDADAFRRPRRAWLTGYFSPQVGRAFDRLFRDEALQEAFAGAWAALADALRGVDAVVAFDLLNEPFPGTIPLPVFETRALPDLYGRVLRRLRASGHHGWAALEPASTTNVGYRSRLRPPTADRVIFAPHLYPPAIEVGLGYLPDPRFLDAHLSTLVDTARALGVPLVVGELGVRRDVPGAARYLADAWDALDRAMAGALHWDLGRGGPGSYALWDEEGRATDLARAIARPAPVRLAGEPLRWRWSAADGSFEARWREDGSAAGDSLFAVPTLAFPRGLEIRLDGVPVDLAGGDRARLRVPQEGGDRRLVVRSRPA